MNMFSENSSIFHFNVSCDNNNAFIMFHQIKVANMSLNIQNQSIESTQLHQEIEQLSNIEELSDFIQWNE